MPDVKIPDAICQYRSVKNVGTNERLACDETIKTTKNN